MFNMSQKVFQTQLTTIQIYKESLPILNKKTHLIYKSFDDLWRRIANLKSVEKWEKEFKSYSIMLEN